MAPGIPAPLLYPMTEETWALPSMFSQDLLGLGQLPGFSQKLEDEEDENGAMLDVSMLQSAEQILESGPMDAGSSGELVFDDEPEMLQVFLPADMEDVAATALMYSPSSHEFDQNQLDVPASNAAAKPMLDSRDLVQPEVRAFSQAFEDYGHILSQSSLEGLVMPTADLLLSLPPLMPAVTGASKSPRHLSGLRLPAVNEPLLSGPVAAMHGGTSQGSCMETPPPQQSPAGTMPGCMVPSILQQLSPGGTTLSPMQPSVGSMSCNPEVTIIIPRRVSRPPPFKSKLMEEQQQYVAAASSRSVPHAVGGSSPCIIEWHAGTAHPELSSSRGGFSPSTDLEVEQACALNYPVQIMTAMPGAKGVAHVAVLDTGSKEEQVVNTPLWPSPCFTPAIVVTSNGAGTVYSPTTVPYPVKVITPAPSPNIASAPAVSTVSPPAPNASALKPVPSCPPMQPPAKRQQSATAKVSPTKDKGQTTKADAIELSKPALTKVEVPKPEPPKPVRSSKRQAERAQKSSIVANLRSHKRQRSAPIS